jgi:ketosteroid isomerase-like protein
MSDADAVLEAMCQSYSSAVNASDSARYSALFTEDAIRMPPGADPEYGRDEIQKGEQADYDVAKWNVTFTPRDCTFDRRRVDVRNRRCGRVHGDSC